MKFLLGFVVFIIIVPVFYTVLAKYKNRRLKPDYYDYYKIQDCVPKGKIGIFVTGLIMPEKMDYPFFYNITQKIFNAIIPWPFRLFSKLDKGVALLDSIKYHEHHEFTPTRLVDPYGNDRDIDGEPFIEKYKKGEAPDFLNKLLKRKTEDYKKRLNPAIEEPKEIKKGLSKI